MQDAVIDFLCGYGVPVTLRDKSISMPQEADEEWSAGVYFIKTYIEGPASFGVLFTDAPAKIDIDEIHIQSTAFLFEFGKDKFDEIIPFFVHIPEGRGYKHPYAAPLPIG